ncbi:MAG: L,D-transpeptidase family protein [Pseudomonadota bacterium]
MNLFTNRIRAALTISAVFFIVLWPGMGNANPVGNALNDSIQKRLEAAVENPFILCEGAIAYAPAVLQDIYTARSFRPAWIDSQGPLPPVEVLLNAIRRAEQEGLKPEEYHLSEMTALISAWRTSRGHNLPFPIAKQIDLELLLTDALVAYGFHLLNGRVDPERLYPDWFSYQKDVYLFDVIENALNTGKVEAAFRRLAPHDPLYRGLKQALAVYANIAGTGGWPELPQSRHLKTKADHRRYLLLLKQRLLLTGDLLPAESSGRNDDESMKNAIRRFQKRHGIKADGTIGPATLKEMNVPVEKRIRQITLNMERLRWLPENVGNRYILVNIADFELIVFEDGSIVMDMPIVVGKQNQRTSVFSGKMTYLELNPYWNIPKAIAEKEILPEVRKDPAYLTKKKIRVIEYRRPQEKEVDPATIDWSKIRPDKLKYSFRQDYGSGNALGRIKFMFPNKFDIYLHDTPDRHLFKRTRRTFSHGCIRIAKPIDLAEYLLKNENGWDHKKILAEIGKGKRQILKLSHPIDLHILYLTAWTTPQGDVQFRNDVYEGDDVLLRALSEKPRSLYPDDVRKPKEIPGSYGERF